MKKYYAIIAGQKKGIHYDEWENIEPRVKGISNIKYKSFKNKEDAENFLNQNTSDIGMKNASNTDIKNKIENLNPNELIAFVDGSFSENLKGKFSKKYSYGAIIISRVGGKQLEDKLFNSYKDLVGTSLRNVAGELKGIKEVLKWTISNGFKKITFYYDYAGIEKWITGEWTAKNQITKEYVEFVNNVKKINNIEINFCHVKAHSGISYNEQVDKLAKSALQGASFKTNSDGSTYVTGFTRDKFLNLLDQFKNNTERNILLTENKKDIVKLFWQKEELTITFYEQSRSLYLQGKSGNLFQSIFDLIVNNLDNSQNTLYALNNFYKLSVTQQFINERFDLEMPIAKSKENNEKVKATLENIIYNNQIKEYRPDYSFFLLPVGRFMEHALHEMLGKAGVDTNREKMTKNGRTESNTFGGHMERDSETGHYVVSTRKVKEHLSPIEIDLINQIYNWYSDNRHQIAHFPKDPESAVIIDNIDELHHRIEKGEKLIEDFYRIFK